jgi:hypothetical protein
MPTTTAIEGDPLTLVRRVKDELRRSRDVDDDFVSKALVSAVRHYRSHEFFFNKGEFTIDLTQGDFEYGIESAVGAQDGYPLDLMSIDTFRLKQGTFELKIIWRSPAWIRERVFSSTYTGYPYVVGWQGETLIVAPAAHADNLLTFEADYHKDIGTPKAVLNGTDWEFQDEDGVEWSTSYTNAWYGEAEELIRYRIKKDLYANVIGDLEQAMAMESLERAEYRNLKRRSGQIGMLIHPEPWE